MQIRSLMIKQLPSLWNSRWVSMKLDRIETSRKIQGKKKMHACTCGLISVMAAVAKFLSLVTENFILFDQIKSNCVFRLHLKSEKNRTEPNELDELKCSESIIQTLTCFPAFACSHQNIYLFIPIKIRKKDWAKWARWARMLKNTLTDEHLYSLTCFLYLLA